MEKQEKSCPLGHAECGGWCAWYREHKKDEDEHLHCGLLYELRRIGNGPVEAIILNLGELA
jgi:hypothetical protein